MSASALTRRYAKALVELATEEQAIDRYGEELAMVNAVLDREALLRLLLELLTVEGPQRSEIRETVRGGEPCGAEAGRGGSGLMHGRVESKKRVASVAESVKLSMAGNGRPWPWAQLQAGGE